MTSHSVDSEKLFHDPNSRKVESRYLLNLCHDAKTITDILDKVPQALEDCFGAKVFLFTYRVSYDSSVPNTHCCPIDGVTNFLREEGTPTDYRGFRGHFNIHIQNIHNVSFFSSLFSRYLNSMNTIAGINIGSGGGNLHQLYINEETGEIIDNVDDYSYQLTVYEDDFPSLKKVLNERRRYFKLAHPGDYEYEFNKSLKDIEGKYTRSGYSRKD